MALCDEGPHLEHVVTPRGSRWPMLVALLVVAAVTVLIVKPWGENARPADRPDLAHAETAEPTPTAVPTSTIDPERAAALRRRQCLSGSGWRIVSMESDGDATSRTLWDVPQLAASPAAALSARRTVSARAVVALGYCTPGESIANRGERVNDAALWRRTPDGSLQRIEDSRPIDPELVPLGEVYLAPGPETRSPTAWPSGDYLFEVTTDGDNASGWFALEVTTVER